MSRKKNASLSLLKKQLSGASNEIHFGDTRVPERVRYPTKALTNIDLETIELSYHNATSYIMNTFYKVVDESQVFHHPSPLESAIRKKRSLFRHMPNMTASPEPFVLPTNISIVTPFYKHLVYFRRCAQSVARAAAWGRRKGVNCEWIIVNDDPIIKPAELEAYLPEAIIPITKIVENPSGNGISATLNFGINTACHDWIALLDCDDMIRFDALAIVSWYINKVPSANYISSTSADIDHSGTIIRVRSRNQQQSDLVTFGMLFGHLKCFRRSSMLTIGLHNPNHDGCQDFELAVRIALRHPILMIPEPIYYYRFHATSQSVAAERQQHARFKQVLFETIMIGTEQLSPVGREFVDISELSLCILVDASNFSELSTTMSSIVQNSLSAPVTVVMAGPLEQFEVLREWISSNFDCHTATKWVDDLAPDCLDVKAIVSDSYGFFPSSRAIAVMLSGDEILPFFKQSLDAAFETATESLIILPIMTRPNQTEAASEWRAVFLRDGDGTTVRLTRPLISGRAGAVWGEPLQTAIRRSTVADPVEWFP